MLYLKIRCQSVNLRHDFLLILSFNRRLREPRFGQIGSGLYGELRKDDGTVIWQSKSALGMDIPAGEIPAMGNHLFARETMLDGTPLLTLSLAVEWEFDDNSSKSYVFKVAESMSSFNAQVAEFRRQLFSWFAGVALTMLSQPLASMPSITTKYRS